MKTNNKRNTIRKRIRRNPRISINKLGEYITESSPTRRRKILSDQKQPSDFIPPYYDPARDAIIRFMTGGGQTPEVIMDEIARLSTQEPDSPWKAMRNKSCCSALKKFLQQFGEFLLKHNVYAVSVKRNDPSALYINGVKVTLRPDVLLYDEKKDGTKIVGAVKLYFPKTHPLNKESGQYIATALHEYVEEQLTDEDVVSSRQYCIVLDIFNGVSYKAPIAFKSRRKAIEAACQEIAAIWPHL